MTNTKHENELIEAHQRGVEEGLKHSKSSPETIRLITEQREYFAMLLDAHEEKDMNNYKEIHDLIVDHIKETAQLNKAFGDIISGGRLVSFAFATFVKFIAGMGVIMGGLYAIKEWTKR